MNRHDTLDGCYREIAYDLLTFGHKSHGTLEINNYTFTLTDITKNIVSVVPVDYGYMCGEMLWYALGSEDIKFIQKFKSTGFNRTSNEDWSNSAYGNIVYSRHGFDQVKQVIDTLKAKPDSRRAIINLNVPNRHRATCLDEICTIALQFYINDGKLDCTGIMRSNDAYGCLPYDVAWFTELQKHIADEVGVGYGTYTHFAVSFHAYERDLDKLKNLIPDKKYSISYPDICTMRDELKSILDKNTPKDGNYNNILLNFCKKMNIFKEVK